MGKTIRNSRSKRQLQKSAIRCQISDLQAQASQAWRAGNTKENIQLLEDVHFLHCLLEEEYKGNH